MSFGGLWRQALVGLPALAREYVRVCVCEHMHAHTHQPGACC